MATLIVKPRTRVFHGHTWIYASDIKNLSGNPQSGEVIQVKDIRGKFLGSAIYSEFSQIKARIFSYRNQKLDVEFFERRLLRAIEVRKNLGIDLNMARVVWSESDGLPGVILDQYGDTIVFQTLTAAMDKHQAELVEAIDKVFSPKVIVERNEVNVRKAEGLEQRKGILKGELQGSIPMSYQGMFFNIDFLDGHKTGLYLDQLDNYLKIAQYAKGKRVLDCFCNQGGFAQACKLAGAAEVTAVDISETAIETAKGNAQRAGVEIQWVAENCFDFLKKSDVEGKQYDLIILDPPSFTKNKQSVKDAMRGYKEIHLRALKMLAPGGIMATYSCSHHVSVGEFHESIIDAAVDAKKVLRRVDCYFQRADHPVLATLPETEYLRGFAYEVAGSW
jgi:23S rRNA (cytosine1962-C5)-methyltransferase